MIRSFRNCYRFQYTATNHDNMVLEHTRTDSNKWLSEKRDRYGDILGRSIRTDAEMQHIYNHMQCVAECSYYSLSSNSDFSPYSV